VFDIGFSELLLVLIVGLVVLGPQRLPIAIRTVMGWVRTIRGLAANVQNELAQELKLQELKDSIKKAEELNLSSLSPELSKTVAELKQSADKMQQDLNTTKGEITKLTDEQVAEIQAKIETESKLKDVEQAVENVTQITPRLDTSGGTSDGRFIALMGALVMVNLMLVGGDESMVKIIGRSFAHATGEYWTIFASYLGAVGAFFSGSNTVSNLTFGSVQLSTAEITGISASLVLALQSAGGAMGNMVCINNIVAVNSVLGIENQEGAIIKKTVVPMFIYGIIAAIVALTVIPLFFNV